jgi:hypothetical protein
MYASVRRYRGNAELADQLAGREDDIKSVLLGVSGFAAYYLIRAENETISVSVFDDESGARQSNEEAASWLRENMPDVAVSPPEVSGGDVVITFEK